MCRTQSHKINRLIIVAGPPGAGKSTLISKLANRDCPTISDQLGFDPENCWQCLEARQLTTVDDAQRDRLILHYDIFSQREKNPQFTNLDNLINLAKNTSILTLLTPLSDLKARNRRRLAWSLKLLVEKPTFLWNNLARTKLMLRQTRLYLSPTRTTELYRAWFLAIANCNPEKNLILDTQKYSEVTCLSEKTLERFFLEKIPATRM